MARPNYLPSKLPTTRNNGLINKALQRDNGGWEPLNEWWGGCFDGGSFGPMI